MKIELYGNRELVHRGKLELHTGEIHIWKIQWRELETFWKRYNSLLEKEECQKTEHYRFYEDQMRYLAGKIAVRILLKEYSGVDKIVLGKGKYGKLYWKAPPGQKEITFSLSHVVLNDLYNNVGLLTSDPTTLLLPKSIAVVEENVS